jgi:hypothetical protein
MGGVRRWLGKLLANMIYIYIYIRRCNVYIQLQNCWTSGFPERLRGTFGLDVLGGRDVGAI